MKKKRRGEGARAERGVGRGGTGDIHTARRGHIGGTDREIDHIDEQRIGRLKGIRIDESGQEATREGEMMTGRLGDGGNGATRQTHKTGEGTRELENMVIEDRGLSFE